MAPSRIVSATVDGDGARVLERLRALPGAAHVLDALAAHPGVWAVGGAVRDALLGRAPRELDFVVEGDAVAVARTLGEPVVHAPFGTATVGGVDLATARRETYPEPGVLPVVVPGASLEEDLARRDFTVNAIAVQVSDGSLKEWPGAREDLAAGVLRVLHGRSFLDDPTRLLRMARYGARLGFTVEPSTAALAARADPWPAGGSRLGAELRRLAAEPAPACMERLADFGLGAALLGPAFDPSPVARAVALLDSPLVALGAAGATDRERLDALAFPAAERDVLVACGAPWVREALEREDWVAVRRARPEAVAVAGAHGPAGTARRWLEELSGLRLSISGEDVITAGLSGPAVGEALERAWAALYAGGDRDAQLAAALRVVL
jgi:tRNA nucleotidyltransferase (CCA-adding enzyme)